MSEENKEAEAPDQDAMAREMEKSLDAGRPDELSQSDIDEMMGGATPAKKVREFSTLEERIIYMSMLNFEKLPMLDVIFERMVMSLSNSLKNYTSATADITLNSIEYLSCADGIAKIPVPGLLPIVHADPWDGNIVMGVDAKLLYSTLEIKLGGRNSRPAPTEGRNFTSIEQTIGRGLSKVILKDLEDAFAQLTDVSLDIERVETNPQFATVGQPNSPAIYVRLDVEIDKRRGRIDFVIPYLTIEPIRNLLTKVFFGEKLGGDPTWRGHVVSEIESSEIEVRAVLHEEQVPLEEILSMKPGKVLNLNIQPDQEATIQCAGEVLCHGALGRRKNGMMAIQVTETNFNNKEFIDVLDAD